MKGIIMDNQQLTQTSLAWLAGVWESEGHFSVRRSLQKHNENRPQYSPRIGLTNTNTLLLGEARRILDILGIEYYFREKGHGGFDGSTKQCWVIEICTMVNSVRLIAAIYPYLISKRFQAESIMEFCQRRLKVVDRRKNNNDKRRYTPEEFELVIGILKANGDCRGSSETWRQDAQRAMIQSNH